MSEKNIAEEIKKKHEEFNKDIEAYLNQFRMGGVMPNLSPIIQKLRQTALQGRQQRG